MDTSTKHAGKVIQVTSNEVVVMIEAEGACASCRAKTLCGMSESQDKLISVATPSAPQYHVGEEVEVSVQQQMGIKAVMIAYVFPFLLVMAVLLGLLESGVNELSAGLSALGLLALYYIVLVLFRRRIAKDIVFEIHKLQEN